MNVWSHLLSQDRLLATSSLALAYPCIQSNRPRIGSACSHVGRYRHAGMGDPWSPACNCTQSFLLPRSTTITHAWWCMPACVCRCCRHGIYSATVYHLHVRVVLLLPCKCPLRPNSGEWARSRACLLSAYVFAQLFFDRSLLISLGFISFRWLFMEAGGVHDDSSRAQFFF